MKLPSTDFESASLFSVIFGITQEFTQNLDGLHVNTGA